MSLLYDVVFSSRCRSTHHRLAVEALQHLENRDAELWQNLLLHFHEEYLKGAKAPDDVFKDFKNHVLHVRDKDWGGAAEAATEWQRRTVRALEQRDWQQAAWSAGVMSHYYVDPLQPFHTHQTEEENVIHRAVEWSFNKSYRDFQAILDAKGYPDVECPSGEDWVAQMVKTGALASTKHYELIIDHYNLEAGVKNPPAGLDNEIRNAIAPLVGHAIIGLARILDRTFEEAAVRPPNVGASLQGLFLAMEMPIQAVLKGMDDAAARKEVAAQYEEYRRTGKVRATLGEDDKAVRELFAAEVLKTPLSSLDAKWPRELGVNTRLETKAKAPKPAPAPKAEKPAPAPKKAKAAALSEPTPESAMAAALAAARPSVKPEPKVEAPKVETPKVEAKAPEAKKIRMGTLDAQAPVVDAPSIGPKTAKRLESLGVKTVADLLALSPQDGEAKIAQRHISAQVILDWQAQAALACTVPGLRSREAQALVACGVHNADELSHMDVAELTEAIGRWGVSDEGSRAWGNAPAPTEEDIAEWIARASGVNAPAKATAA